MSRWVTEPSPSLLHSTVTDTESFYGPHEVSRTSLDWSKHTTESFGACLSNTESSYGHNGVSMDLSGLTEALHRSIWWYHGIIRWSYSVSTSIGHNSLIRSPIEIIQISISIISTSAIQWWTLFFNFSSSSLWSKAIFVFSLFLLSSTLHRSILDVKDLEENYLDGFDYILRT
jgi:hypothetical protein